jgi:thiaminase
VAAAHTLDPLVIDLQHRGRQVAAATVGHDFVRRIADGSLPEPAFLHYLEQNALFLTGYAAALGEALAAGVPPHAAELVGSLGASISGPALDRHRSEYRSRTDQDPGIDAAVPTPVTTAYVDHLRASARLGAPAIMVAILPGEQSYAAAGRYYAAEGDLTPANPYADWIAQYATGQVDLLVGELLNVIASSAPTAAVRQELPGIYERAARLDERFWHMAAGRDRD